MSDEMRDTLKAALASVLFLAVLLFGWDAYVQSQNGPAADMDPELAALLGPQAKGQSALPTPSDVGAEIWGHITNPFYDAGPNDKGVGIQLAYSIFRVLTGFGLAALIAIPLGFLIGMSSLAARAMNPYIQLLKPVSPLAWMPLALYTIKDSEISSIFVIFICSIWPMLINTIFGVASVRKEWLNVARTLEVPSLRTAFQVILPAAAPTILTGMRISVGIAWLVIVAAEMWWAAQALAISYGMNGTTCPSPA